MKKLNSLLGVSAALSGYILGVAIAVKQLLDGVSATEVFASASAAVPGFSLRGMWICALLFCLMCAGLSAAGSVFSLPLAAAGTAACGFYSAAVFALYGAAGIWRLAVALPWAVMTFRLMSRASSEALTASWFTLRRLGLVHEPQGQYAEPEEAFLPTDYIKKSLIYLALSLLLPLYGFLTAYLT